MFPPCVGFCLLTPRIARKLTPCKQRCPATVSAQRRLHQLTHPTRQHRRHITTHATIESVQHAEKQARTRINKHARHHTITRHTLRHNGKHARVGDTHNTALAINTPQTRQVNHNKRAPLYQRNSKQNNARQRRASGNTAAMGGGEQPDTRKPPGRTRPRGFHQQPQTTASIRRPSEQPQRSYQIQIGRTRNAARQQ